MSNMIPVRKLNDGSTPYYPINVPETIVTTHDIQVTGGVGGYQDGVIIPRETTLDNILTTLFSDGSSSGSVNIDNDTIIRNQNNAICVAPIKNVSFSSVSNTPSFDVIKYINGKFYAGNSTGLYVSYDAKTWNHYQFNDFSVSTIVAYNYKILIGGHDSNNCAVIAYSDNNGSTFSLCDLNLIKTSIKTINRIEFDPNKEIWVASNYSSNESKYYFCSKDGIEWRQMYIQTSTNSALTYTLCALKLLNDKWYVHGWTNDHVTVLTTDNPFEYWTEVSSLRLDIPGEQPHIHSFNYGNGSYVAGYTNHAKGIWYSRDGLSFTQTSGAAGSARIVTNGLYCNASVWLALDTNIDSDLLYSLDQGFTWNRAILTNKQVTTDDKLVDAASVDRNIEGFVFYNNGVYILICETGIAYSADGINWTKKRMDGVQVNSAVCANGQWVFATNRGIYLSNIQASSRTTVDSELNESSTNPVENRVVTKKLNEMLTLNKVAKLLDSRSMPSITVNGGYKIYDQDGRLNRSLEATSISIEEGFKAVWSGDFWYNNADTTYKKVDSTKLAGKPVETLKSDIYAFGNDTSDFITSSQPLITIQNNLADQISVESIANKFKGKSSANIKVWNYSNVTRRPNIMDINTYQSSYLRMAEGNPDPCENLYPVDYGWAYNTSKTSLAIWSPTSWGLQYMYRYLLHEKIGAQYYLKFPASSDVTGITDLVIKYKNVNTGDIRFFDYNGSFEPSVREDDTLYLLADSSYYYKKVIRERVDGEIKYLTDYKVNTDNYTMYRFDNDDLYVKVRDTQNNNRIAYLKANYSMNYTSSGNDYFVDINNQKVKLGSGTVVVDTDGYQIANGTVVKSGNIYKVNRFSNGLDVNYIFDNYEKIVFTIEHSNNSSPSITWKKSKYETFEESNIRIITREVNGTVHTIVTDNTTELDITCGGVSVWLYPTESGTSYTNVQLVHTKDNIYMDDQDRYYLCRGNFSIELKSGVYVSNGHVKGYMTDSTVVSGSATYSATYDTNRYQLEDTKNVYTFIDPELLGIISPDSTSEFYHYISGFGHVITKKIEFNTDDYNSFDHKVLAMETPSGLVIPYDVYVVHVPRFTPINERILYTTEERKLTARYYAPTPGVKPLTGHYYYIDELDDLYNDIGEAATALNLNDITLDNDEDLIDVIHLICETYPDLRDAIISTETDDGVASAVVLILETLGADVDVNPDKF